MFGRYERMVAWRYLRARKGERFASLIALFSLLGIALGVATLIIVMAVMNGFKKDLMDRVLGLHGDLNVYGHGRPITHYESILDRLAQVPSVTRVLPMAQGTVLLQAPGYTAGALLEGLRVEDLQHWPALSGALVDGSWENLGRPHEAAIGVGMARKVHLHIGDHLTLLSPDGRATIAGSLPRVEKFEVGAVFDANWNDYNSSVVITGLQNVQNFLMLGDGVSLIQVNIRDSLQAGEVAGQIEALLADPRLEILDWSQSANGFLEAVTVEQNVMFLILSLIILVAAFNVVSSLIMMVKDKGRDIAIMRGFGVTQGGIMRIFLMAGAFVGVVGTCLGALIGTGFALNIERIRIFVEKWAGTSLFNSEVYFLAHLPARLEWVEVGLIVGLSLLLSLLATLYPSWRASRMEPITLLRHEG